MIEKTDAHHHLWSLAAGRYPMLTASDMQRQFGNTAGLKRDFWAAEFLPLAAQQNVTKSVHVEAHHEPAMAETAVIDAFADAHGFPHAIVGRVDPASPTLAAELDIHQRSARFRGVRTMIGWDADPILCASAGPDAVKGAAWRAGYAAIGRRGLSVEVMATPAQLVDLAELAASASETTLIVGHSGMPLRRTPAEHDVWRAGMAALAALPHVVVKISGLGMVDHHWTVDSIRPLVTQMIDLFGPDRAMFGSNFPVDGLHASYARIWDAFDAITANMTEADRTALFRGTAARVYRI